MSVLIPGYICSGLFCVKVTLGFACRVGVSVLISRYIVGEALVRLVLHYDVTSFLTHGTE